MLIPDRSGTIFITTSIQQPSGQPYRKKSKKEIQQDIDKIGRLLASGAIDREIMEQLHLKKSQYYAYRARLFKESGLLFDRTTDDELIHQKTILQERFIRLYRRLELDLNQGDINGSNRPGLYLAGQSIATNIFKLNYEGLKALKRNGINTNRYLRRIELGSGSTTDSTNNKVGVLPRYTESGSPTEQAVRTSGNTGNTNQIPDQSEVY